MPVEHETVAVSTAYIALGLLGFAFNLIIVIMILTVQVQRDRIGTSYVRHTEKLFILKYLCGYFICVLLQFSYPPYIDFNIFAFT
jgi:hypothetical protein